MMRATAILLCVLAPAVLARAAEKPSFSKKPVASKTADGKVKISFAVSRATDVAVFIEDAKGNAVRHLVAGMVGNPPAVSKDEGCGGGKPPAPLKPGLAQSLEWDGLDDYGKKALGGPFKVRVALGLSPTFDRFLLGQPRSTGLVEALAVGPKGRVYAFNRNEGLVHWWSHNIKLMDRDGKHVKALTPFPADIDPAKVKAIAPHKTKDGHLMPRVYQGVKFGFYTDLDLMGFGRSGGNTSPAVGSDGRVYFLARGPRLACVDADGGIPYDTFLGPRLLGGVKGLTADNRYKYGSNAPALVVSSDNKHVHIVGLNTYANKKTTWLPCVYRVDLETRSKAEVFVGKPGSPGKEKGLLTAPRGLALGKGLLYVADAEGGRVVVFKEADRSYAGEIKVKSPYSIGVDPATGAVYVCSRTGKASYDLIKFAPSTGSGPGGGYKEVCKIALPSFKHGRQRIAVDATRKPVLVWVPSAGRWGKKDVTCIEDKNGSFASRKIAPRGGAIYRDLTFDRRRGELYTLSAKKTWLRIDDKTGKVTKKLKLGNNYGPQLVPAPDGSLISAESWGGGLRRYDRDGKPLNWPGQKTSRYNYGGIMNFMQRNLALTDLDNVYALFPPGYLTNNKKKKYGVTGATRNTVDVFGADGKPKRTAVWQCTHGGILRVDHKGYVYLADMVSPPGRGWPKFFDDKFKGEYRPSINRSAKPDQFWLTYLYGSIIKFKPSGGAIWFGSAKGQTTSPVGKPSAEFLASPAIKTGTPRSYHNAKGKSELQGAEWYRFGFAPFGVHTSSWECSCEGAGFDVDLFGRVFYPNVPQFRVEVVDAANNMIGTFGKYGNQDSGGKDATVKKPEIPMAWPLTVAVSDNYAYVADTINRRLIRVKLGYATEESAKLP